MPTISFEFKKEAKANTEMNAGELEQYLKQERTDDSIEHYSGFKEGEVMEQIRGNAEFHNSKSVNAVLTVTQSWHPKESKLLSPVEFANMGIEFMNRMFPGHNFYLRLHNEKAHIHNHIFIDPVHPETGKRIQNKMMWKTMTKHNDAIAQEKGLSILKSVENKNSKSLPKEVHQIKKRGGDSYRLDMMAKAEVAGLFATNYDEYVAAMGGLGINVLVKNKNITYQYGNKKQVRGDKLGERYDKEFLERRFKKNDELFTKRPHFRDKLSDKINELGTVKRDFVGNASKLLPESEGIKKLAQKDYSKYTNVKRTHNPLDYPAISELTSSNVPVKALLKARNGNVLDYAKKNGFEVIENKKGHKVLKDRKYIILKEDSWYNAKNKTNGSLIEFVAFHKDISFLKAAAQITGNNRLLWLDKNLDKPISQFKSFNVPKSIQEKRAKAVKTAAIYLKRFGVSDSKAFEFLEKRKFQVSKQGAIRFFDEKEKNGFIERSMDSKGNVKKTKDSKPSGIFYSHESKSKNVTVFGSPEEYFESKKSKSFNEKGGENTIVLMNKNLDGLDQFLIANPNINKVTLVGELERSIGSEKLGKYKDAGIELNSIAKHLNKNLGLEIE